MLNLTAEVCIASGPSSCLAFSSPAWYGEKTVLTVQFSSIKPEGEGGVIGDRDGHHLIAVGDGDVEYSGWSPGA